MPVRVDQKSIPQISHPSPATLSDVVRGLQNHAGFELSKPYRSALSPGGVAEAWKHKDTAGVQAWASPAMGKVFAFATNMNTGSGGDYLDRALSQNMDASIWLQALEHAGVIEAPTKEWRQAIELASLTLDVGDDGAGRTGFMYVMTGVDGYPSATPEPSVAMPPGLMGRAGMLVGASGGGGLYVEKVFDGPNVASDFAHRLANESNGKQSAKGLTARAVDPKAVQAEIKNVEDGAFVKTRADRTSFADAVLITKLADRSRGEAFRVYLAAGGGEKGLEALQSHRDWANVVEKSFEAHKQNRKD